MRFMQFRKDGGPNSTVDGFFVIEIKRLFSIVVLRFGQGSRDDYHSHAFNALTWWLTRGVIEYTLKDGKVTSKAWGPSLFPKVTPKSQVHKLFALKTAWAVSVRGPWSDYWVDVNVEKNTITTYTWGRKVVSVERLTP